MLNADIENNFIINKFLSKIKNKIPVEHYEYYENILNAYFSSDTLMVYFATIYPDVINILEKLYEYEPFNVDVDKIYNNYFEAIYSGNLFMFCVANGDIPLKWDIDQATKGTPFYRNSEFLYNFLYLVYSDLDSSIWLYKTPKNGKFIIKTIR